jgi:hypothetical protein
VLIFAASRQTKAARLSFPLGFGFFPGIIDRAASFLEWSGKIISRETLKTKKHEDRPRAFLLEMDEMNGILPQAFSATAFSAASFGSL